MYVNIRWPDVESFSDMCKKCLIADHLPTNRCFGADPCYFVFQVNNISSDHSILFHFGHVLMRDHPSYIGMGVVHLLLCHVTRTIVALQHTNNECLHVQQDVLMT